MESPQHTELVSCLYKWVITYEPLLLNFVATDTIGGPLRNLPPYIGGHRPDLFAENINQDKVVVGEAKTSGDVVNDHTESQLVGFLNYLKYKKNSVLLLSLELHDCQSGQSMIRKLMRQVEATSEINFCVITPVDFVP